MSQYLQNRGSYDLASTLVEQASELYERVLGKEHPDTLTTMNNLAGVLDN
jgi:tetratricopeptide (TPR) repeat protein